MPQPLRSAYTESELGLPADTLLGCETPEVPQACGGGEGPPPPGTLWWPSLSSVSPARQLGLLQSPSCSTNNHSPGTDPDNVLLITLFPKYLLSSLK